MNVMNVMPQLSLSSIGPVNAAGEAVHFRQGDLDGACGPYSLMMALVANGIISRDEASYSGLQDGRTRLGRFYKRLIEFGGLINNGTTDYDLDWLLDCFRNQISLGKINGTTRSLVTDLVGAVTSGYSTIVGVNWPGGEGHWLLVVGYQGQITYGLDGDSKTNVTHLLCLDPFLEAPRVSLWNAVLEVQTGEGLVVNTGRYPSNHWGGINPTKCLITNGLAIGKRR